ncbi:HK97 gp10 family phage protein [Priestia flexa]|uniref:HK97-gp10 family putative phage morphogenesis protein n=1 Tax=Priestia flexa TaxID=86664 RepID=UPI000C2516DB|nr:HK97-gp10 family putative phage morphogenesis protein [Priestia flexa]MEC0664484.1 HK97 gp10 family phage protein [Priestia flexa]
MSMNMVGMKNLMNELKKLETLGDRIAEKALQAGAKILQREIIKRTPERTGNLAENIIVSKVVQGYIDIGPDFKNAFYARFLEYGTSTMDAQPFIEPAFLAVKDEVQAVMAQVIRQELSKL